VQVIRPALLVFVGLLAAKGRTGLSLNGAAEACILLSKNFRINSCRLPAPLIRLCMLRWCPSSSSGIHATAYNSRCDATTFNSLLWRTAFG
jgi:hypothetical protein